MFCSNFERGVDEAFKINGRPLGFLRKTVK
jgi:hypothetical protein